MFDIITRMGEDTRCIMYALLQTECMLTLTFWYMERPMDGIGWIPATAFRAKKGVNDGIR